MNDKGEQKGRHHLGRPTAQFWSDRKVYPRSRSLTRRTTTPAMTIRRMPSHRKEKDSEDDSLHEFFPHFCMSCEQEFGPSRNSPSSLFCSEACRLRDQSPQSQAPSYFDLTPINLSPVSTSSYLFPEDGPDIIPRLSPSARPRPRSHLVVSKSNSLYSPSTDSFKDAKHPSTSPMEDADATPHLKVSQSTTAIDALREVARTLPSSAQLRESIQGQKQYPVHEPSGLTFPKYAPRMPRFPTLSLAINHDVSLRSRPASSSPPRHLGKGNKEDNDEYAETRCSEEDEEEDLRSVSSTSRSASAYATHPYDLPTAPLGSMAPSAIPSTKRLSLLGFCSGNGLGSSQSGGSNLPSSSPISTSTSATSISTSSLRRSREDLYTFGSALGMGNDRPLPPRAAPSGGAVLKSRDLGLVMPLMSGK